MAEVTPGTTVTVMPRSCKYAGFLAAAPEDEGVAPLQPADAFPAQRVVGEQLVDFLLGDRGGVGRLEARGIR